MSDSAFFAQALDCAERACSRRMMARTEGLAWPNHHPNAIRITAAVPGWHNQKMLADRHRRASRPPANSVSAAPAWPGLFARNTRAAVLDGCGAFLWGAAC